MEPCARCAGTGFEIVEDEEGATRARPCPCREDVQRSRLLAAARIPRRYDHCTLETFEPHHPSHEAARKLAMEWLERWPLVEHGLLFVGPPGTGKTHLAVGLLRALVSKKGTRVLFYEQRELLKALQGTFDAAASTREAEILAPVQEVDVLLLDDVGAGRVTPWAREVLHDIIVHRYNHRLPLLMTTNHRAEEHDSRNEDRLSLPDRLGEALMSRIYEMCVLVPVEGQDYRRGVLHARHQF